MSKQLPRLPPGAHAAAPLHLRCPWCARYRDTCSSSSGATCWASRPTSSVAKTCGAIAARRRMSRRTSLMAPLAQARRRLSHARGHAVGGAAILIERSSTLKALNKWWRWPEPRLVQASFRCQSFSSSDVRALFKTIFGSLALVGGCSRQSGTGTLQPATTVAWVRPLNTRHATADDVR